MKRQTVIDISKYTFQEAEHSFCRCGRSVFLLMTREPDRDAPAFYMCVKCGRIAQVGVGSVSPPEAGISKAVKDGVIFGEEAKAACDASRRTMKKIREEDDDLGDAVCLNHAHRTREEEAICSLRFQIARLREELDAAYAELRKLRPSLTAVFDREVHERAKAAAGRKG